MPSNSQTDYIVREVIRRLRDGDVDNQSGNPTQTARATHDLEINERVVSLGSLDGRLEGIRRLLLPPGAIVTPSARDELRKRNIVTVCANSHGTKNATPITLATWQTAYDAAGLLNSLRADGFEVTELDAAETLEPVIRTVMGTGPRENGLAVLLTDNPSLALCLLSQPPVVRSAWGIDQRSVTDALRCTAANVLVLQPARQGQMDMVDMARTFAQGGGGPCPVALKKRFCVATEQVKYVPADPRSES